MTITDSTTTSTPDLETGRRPGSPDRLADPPTTSTSAPASISTDADPTRDALLRTISDGIGTLASRRRCAAARQVHHSGISLGHLQILWILQEHGPLPVSRLAEWLGIGVPNATGLLDRMEQRGLVERSRDAGDRRVVLVCQTEGGRAAIADHDGWREELVGSILAPLSTDALARLADRVRELGITAGGTDR